MMVDWFSKSSADWFLVSVDTVGSTVIESEPAGPAASEILAILAELELLQ